MLPVRSLFVPYFVQINRNLSIVANKSSSIQKLVSVRASSKITQYFFFSILKISL